MANKKSQEKEQEQQVQNDGVAQGLEQNDAEKRLADITEAFKDANGNELGASEVLDSTDGDFEEKNGLLEGLLRRGEVEDLGSGRYRYVGK